jgi:hypothetical protein
VRRELLGGHQQLVFYHHPAIVIFNSVNHEPIFVNEARVVGSKRTPPGEELEAEES